MELMEHYFREDDICSNYGCNVMCPLNNSNSNNVIENCYYREGEEK